jgi:hypothetical protein
MSMDVRTLTRDNAKEIAQWCGGRVVTEHDALAHDVTSPGVNVPVGTEVERASLGDMVFQKDDGSFGVFKG